MSPPVELILRFDGTTPGLSEHVLSLSAFKKSLPLLLAAVQKTVDIVTGTPEVEAERRKAAAKGKDLDLQIVSVGDGSLTLKLALVLGIASEPSLLPIDFFTDIAARTAERFTEDVKAEWENRGTRESIRRYMVALPRGIDEQDYDAVANGTVLKSVKLSTREVVEELRQMVPRTKEIHGSVYGVTFDESTGRVKLRDATGVIHSCRAMPQVIEMAVRLRKASVSGMILCHNEEKRLLTIRESGLPRSTMTQVERSAFLVEHWKEALQRLAE